MHSERQRVLAEPEPRRRDRYVQLRLRAADHPEAQSRCRRAIPMISPANTLVCITEGEPGCAADEPDKYYPGGTRNYARRTARRLPGRGDGRVRAVQEHQVGLHPERQGVVRAGRRRTSAARPRISASRCSGSTHTTPDRRASRPCSRRSRNGSRRGLHRRPDRRELGSAHQRQGGRAGREHGQPRRRVMLLLPDGFTTDAVFDPGEAGRRTPAGRTSASPASRSTSSRAPVPRSSSRASRRRSGGPVEPYRSTARSRRRSSSTRSSRGRDGSRSDPGGDLQLLR